MKHCKTCVSVCQCALRPRNITAARDSHRSCSISPTVAVGTALLKIGTALLKIGTALLKVGMALLELRPAYSTLLKVVIAPHS